MEEKHYSALQKKHKLPKFNALDLDFDIAEIETENKVLKSIVRKIGEKLEYFIKLLDGLIHPEANPSSIYECSAFDDEEKREIFEIYKHMMYWHRQAISLELEHMEEKSAHFIAEFYTEWQVLKKRLGSVIEKLKKNWRKETTSKETQEYFG